MDATAPRAAQCSLAGRVYVGDGMERMEPIATKVRDTPSITFGSATDSDVWGVNGITQHHTGNE